MSEIDYSNMTKREKKLMLAGEFIGAFIDVLARLSYTVEKCQEVINNSDNKEEIEKAKSTIDNAMKVKNGIRNYRTLKNDASYKVLFKEYGIDTYYETLIRLLEEVC